MPKTAIMNAVAGIKISDFFVAGEYRCKGYEQGEPCDCHGAILVHPDLAMIDSAFRAHLGEPMTINSGFRCKAKNAHEHGDKNSAHMKGCASDKTSAKIRAYLIDMRPREETWTPQEGDLVDTLAEIISSICGPERGNIIVYPNNGFIHADCFDRMSPTGHMIRRKTGRKEAPYHPVEWFSSVV